MRAHNQRAFILRIFFKHSYLFDVQEHTTYYIGMIVHFLSYDVYNNNSLLPRQEFYWLIA